MSIPVIAIPFSRTASVLIAALLLFVVTACYNHPVRHLTGEVSLIKAGVTTREEAKAILGEPDARRQLSPTVEEWQYQEQERSLWQKTPVVGDSFSPKGYRTVILTLEGDLVTGARYVTYNRDEMNWKKDCKWQAIEGAKPTPADGK